MFSIHFQKQSKIRHWRNIFFETGEPFLKLTFLFGFFFQTCKIIDAKQKCECGAYKGKHSHYIHRIA
jgi:hypothetical protein